MQITGPDVTAAALPFGELVDAITLFKSAGTVVEDLAVAALAYRRSAG